MVASEEEIETVHEALGQMPAELLEALQDALHRSKTGEEFVNRIMVGECPKCGSEDTRDCEHDPEIDSVAVGRCLDCGHLWCTVCSGLLEEDCPSCACWEQDELITSWFPGHPTERNSCHDDQEFLSLCLTIAVIPATIAPARSDLGRERVLESLSAAIPTWHAVWDG